MNEALKRMLAEVKKRHDANFAFKSFGQGLSTAAQYLKGWSSCLDVKQVEYLKGLDMDAAMKHASQVVTWVDANAVPSDAENAKGSGFDASATLKKFKLPEGTIVPPKTLMVFRNVITTNDEDRDGDVLHTKGAKIDTPMPLLWQHNTWLPIGKMLAVDKHDEKILRVFSALLDMNDLTEDAAKLVEAEALRISHGFIPLTFKEREEDSKRVPWRGFDIEEFEVMEESLVSVPSNRGAVIDMYSRDSFKSAEMKMIGKALFDNRDDKVWPGFKLFSADNKPEGDKADKKPAGKKAGDTKHDAAGPDGVGEGTDAKAAGPGTDAGADSGGQVAESVSVTIDKTNGKRTESIKLAGTDDLQAKLVELGLLKGGRELSKANLQLLREVVEDLKELKSAEGLSRSQVALINKNISALQALIDKNTDQDDPDEGKDADSKSLTGQKAAVDLRYERRGKKGVYVEITGSAESKRKLLEEAVSDALQAFGKKAKDDWSYIVATFPEKNIVFASLWKRTGQEEFFYELEYKFDEAGKATIVGTPKEIDITGVVAPKASTNSASPMKTAIQFITFDADEGQLKRLEEILAARKEISDSFRVGEEFRELVGKAPV